MKIYSVSTRHYFAFGALVSEELSYKLKEQPKVRSVHPDSYLDVRNKDYGGVPFINGQAVPYDPKYHEGWVTNNFRIDRTRRHRNFERRREMQGHSPSANYSGGGAGSNMNNGYGPVPNSGGQYPGGEKRGFGGPNNFAPPNMGSGPTQSHNIPGRDFPPSSNY